jgi:tRNA A-37 threonylcarbamoyl transferase component Bud32
MKLTRIMPWVYRIEALIREIPDAMNLRDFLAAERDAAVPRTRERRKAALRLAAGAVRALHDAAVIHGDLNMMNILVVSDDEGPKKAFIIDLDKSEMAEGAGLEPRLGNLSRLNRSAEKLAADGKGVSKIEKMRFLQQYFGGTMPEKKILTAFFNECGRSLARHRALWPGPGADAKAGGAL